MVAIERLRGDTPIYFRNSRKENDRKASDGVERWLDTAIKVDSIARDLVQACVNSAIANASKDEEEWLGTGLKLSTDNDMDAKVIIKLTEQFREEQKESPEKLAMKRFQQFGEICLQIADQMRSSIGDSQNQLA